MFQHIQTFTEPTQYPGEGPRSSAPSSAEPPPDYTIDYASLDYNHGPADYDAFDYINGDFDKVPNKQRPSPPSRHKGTSKYL